jgi:hypothetical protein
MTRRRRLGHGRLRTLIGAASAAGALAILVAEPGAADAAVEAGWWMAPVAVAPDAPDDGLVVQGGPADPLAYAAARFALTPGATPGTLLLRVATDSASTPNTSLALCPLTDAFTPAQGGTMDDAPAYDCERSVEAGPSGDGTTYTFDVATLADDGSLAIAILPTTPTARVVLAAPGADSLTAVGPVAAGPFIDTPLLEAPSSGPLDVPTPELPLDGAPSLPPVATPAPEAVERPANPPLGTSPVALQAPGDGSVLRTALVLALVAIAGGLWSAAGAERDDEVSLGAAPV